MHVEGHFKQGKYLSKITLSSNFSRTDNYLYCEHVQNKIKSEIIINVGIFLYLKSVTLA